jgi:hypothetical protein
LNTPKPSPRDLEREARRLERMRQLERLDSRVVVLRPAQPQTHTRFEPGPDPKEAA